MDTTLSAYEPSTYRPKLAADAIPPTCGPDLNSFQMLNHQYMHVNPLQMLHRRHLNLRRTYAPEPTANAPPPTYALEAAADASQPAYELPTYAPEPAMLHRCRTNHGHMHLKMLQMSKSF